MDTQRLMLERRKNVHPSTTSTEGTEKDHSDSQHQIRQTINNHLQNQNSASRQEQTLQDETIDLLVSIKKKGSCLKDKNCDCWHLPLCVFHKRCQCSVGVNRSKGRAIVKQIKARGHFLQESKLEKAIFQRKRDTLSAWGQNESNIKFPGPFET